MGGGARRFVPFTISERLNFNRKTTKGVYTVRYYLRGEKFGKIRNVSKSVVGRWYDSIIRCSTRTSCVLRYGKFSWFSRGRLAFRNRWVKRRSSISVNFVRACAVECNRLIVLTHIFGNFRQSRDQSALHHARRLVYTV